MKPLVLWRTWMTMQSGVAPIIPGKNYSPRAIKHQPRKNEALETQTNPPGDADSWAVLEQFYFDAGHQVAEKTSEVKLMETFNKK